MSGAYTVDTERLRAHASAIADCADRLAALGAGLPDPVGEGTLGSFARPVTTGLGAAMAAVLDAFTEVATAVDQVGVGVRESADRYDRHEDDTAAAFGELR